MRRHVLDAGEFSDLKRDTFLYRIRDFLKGPRPGEYSLLAR